MTLHFQFQMFKFVPWGYKYVSPFHAIYHISLLKMLTMHLAYFLEIQNPMGNLIKCDCYLTPKSDILNSYFATQELRLEHMSVSTMKILPYKKLFVTNMSNAPNTPIL